MMYFKMKVLFTILAVLESVFAAPQINSPVLNLSPSAYAPTVPTHTRFNFIDLELLKHTAEATTGNFMISPASVKSSLGMILEGAKGSCAEELRKNLRLPSDEKLARERLTGFLAELQVHTPGITLQSVNKIFLSHRLTPRQDYVDLLNSYYFSQLVQVDFSKPQQTANEINTWINNSTRGLIPTLVEPNNFEPDTVMLIANALYFKGVWENAFDEKMTMPKCFKTLQGCQTTPMMETQAEFNYGQISELAAQAIELPYQGNRYSMLIILPVDKQGLNFLVKDLPSVPLPQILAQMEKTDVQISMPRFTVDFSVDLVSILRNIGIREVFTTSANLSGIVEGGVTNPQVNNFFHKTRIEVNEQGSVAAAATGAMVVPLMSSTTDRMMIDHPFFFFIRDMKTGAVLFEGRVDEPELVSTNQYNLNTDDLAIFTTTESIRARPKSQPSYQAPNQPSYQAPNQAPNQPSYQAPNQPSYKPPNQPSAQASYQNGDVIRFEPVESEPTRTYPPPRNSQPQPIGAANRFAADYNPATINNQQQIRYQSPQAPSSTNYNAQNTYQSATSRPYTNSQWSQNNERNSRRSQG